VLGFWLIERYARIAHGVRVLGHGLVAATVIGLGVDGYLQLEHVTTQFEWMLVAVFNVGEVLLALMLLVWVAYVLVQATALTLGLWRGPGAQPCVPHSLAPCRGLRRRDA